MIICIPFWIVIYCSFKNMFPNILVRLNVLSFSYLHLSSELHFSCDIYLFLLNMKCNKLQHNICRNPNLGLVTKPRVCKVAGQEEAQEWKNVWRNEPSHPQRSFHFGSLKSRWIPKSSENNSRSQNSIDWRIFYTIENLLKRRCLKWAHMTHLDT
jgi:hypothetical protein